MEPYAQGHTRRPRRIWLTLAAMIVLACVGSIGTALSTTSAGDQLTAVATLPADAPSTPVALSGDVDQSVAQAAAAMALDGHQYPPVVARVNGVAISAMALAQRVYIVEHAGPGAPPVADSVKTALDALIRDEILRQAAKARGIKVSDAEIKDFEQQQQQVLAQSPDGIRQVQQLAALEGDDSLAAYWADPRVIAAYRDTLLLGKMKQQIAQMLVKTLLTPQPNQPENTQQAIDQFVTAQHAHVEIYINQ